MELHKRDESPTKEFVDVIAIHWAGNGTTDPKRLQMEDGTVLIISRVFSKMRAASLRAGGQGMRYDCRVANQSDGHEFRIYLFNDGDYWFIEKTEEGSDLVCADGTSRRLNGKNWRLS